MNKKLVLSGVLTAIVAFVLIFSADNISQSVENTIPKTEQNVFIIECPSDYSDRKTVCYSDGSSKLTLQSSKTPIKPQTRIIFKSPESVALDENKDGEVSKEELLNIKPNQSMCDKGYKSFCK